jgi:hypothetical protein
VLLCRSDNLCVASSIRWTDTYAGEALKRRGPHRCCRSGALVRAWIGELSVQLCLLLRCLRTPYGPALLLASLRRSSPKCDEPGMYVRYGASNAMMLLNFRVFPRWTTYDQLLPRRKRLLLAAYAIALYSNTPDVLLIHLIPSTEPVNETSCRTC